MTGGDDRLESGKQAGVIERLASLLGEDGGLERLEEKLAGIDPATLEGHEREQWFHLRGIVPFRLGDRATAFIRFREAAGACPDSGPILFSLGQEHEHRGEPDEMIRRFDAALFPAVPAEYAMAQARYAYLWGRHDRGRAYVEAMLPAYLELRILDPSFLQMRGLPFFEEVWAALAAFAQLARSFSGLEAFTRRVLAQCSDFDEGRLEAELAWVLTGDTRKLLKHLGASVGKSRRKGWPCGVEALRIATLEGRRLAWSEDAQRLLDSVELGPQDPPWLQDVKLLAGCAIAHRARDSESETRLIREFVSRQPMLLEPWHAMCFGLLEYQESCMDGYRKARLSNTD